MAPQLEYLLAWLRSESFQLKRPRAATLRSRYFRIPTTPQRVRTQRGYRSSGADTGVPVVRDALARYRRCCPAAEAPPGRDRWISHGTRFRNPGDRALRKSETAAAVPEPIPARQADDRHERRQLGSALWRPGTISRQLP